jgi:4-diphosphocytidyl-2-C-methyl-D-erythritol kinase
MSDASLLRAEAPAKINLGLEVIGKRPDGYHDLVTIMQTVNLCDRFEWTPTGKPFEYVGPVGIAPDDDLVLRALALADDRAGWTGRLRLVKQIPAAAGLGGGSSDAALALRIALPSVRSSDLMTAAARLGSDVPCLLRGGTALASGTGTTLEWIPSPDLWGILVTPTLEIPGKTRTLYHGLERGDFSNGERVQQVADRLRSGQALPDRLPNSFERQLLRYAPVRYAYDCLVRAGASLISVSGAGPTLYAIAPDEAQASAIAARMPSDAGLTRVVRTIPAHEDPNVARIASAMRGR